MTRKLVDRNAVSAPTMALAEDTPHHERGMVRSGHGLAHERPGYGQLIRPGRPILFSSQSIPHSVYEREGLTRNPEHCVVYGCIGNN